MSTKKSMMFATRKTGRVYRGGWKSRHDEYEDWANNAGFRVRRRLHSSSLTPYNTYVRETSASRTFLFLFFFSFFLSFVGWLPVPRCRRVLFLPFASFLVFSRAFFLSSFFSIFFFFLKSMAARNNVYLSLLLTQFWSRRIFFYL